MAGVQPYPSNFNPKRDRVSLDEFERFEALLKMQSQESTEGDWMETLREQGVLCDGEFDDNDDDVMVLNGQGHQQLNTSEEEALANQGVLFSTDDLTTDDQREISKGHSNFPSNRQYNNTSDKVVDNDGFDEFLYKSPSPYSIDQEEEPELSYLDDDDGEGSLLSDQSDNRQNSEDFSSYSDGKNVRDNNDEDNPERYLLLNHHNTLARTIHAGVSPHPESFTRESDPVPFSRSQSIRSSLRSLRSEESGSVALDKFLDPELEKTIQDAASQVESFASPRHSSVDGQVYPSENEMDTTGQVTSYMTEEVNDVEVNDSYNLQIIKQMQKEDSTVESYESDTGPVSESANMNLGNFVPKAVLSNRPPKPSKIKLLQNGVLPDRPSKPSAKKVSPKGINRDETVSNVNGEPNNDSNEPFRKFMESSSDSIGNQRELHQSRPRMGSLSNFSIDSDLPTNELIDQLKYEKSTRRQNDELVDRLQQDYDDLLQKYALAEVTIDQLRLGAKVNLYTDPPGTPRSNSRNNTPRSKHPHTFHLAQPQKATVVNTSDTSKNSIGSPYETPVKERSPGISSAMGTGEFTPGDERGNLNFDYSGEGLLIPGDNEGRTSHPEHEDMPSFPGFTGSEGILIGLRFQTKGLEEQVQQFEAQLATDELKPSEQDEIMSKLRADQEKLEHDYMQAKEEHQAMCRREGKPSSEVFDPDKEVEGGIFQLGMKLDDINETVETNLRNQRPETPPTRRDFFPEHSIEEEIAKQRLDMDKQYDILMNRYDQLKKSANHPNRDQEIESLVMKLEKLHHQDPSRYPLQQPGEISSTLPGQYLSTSQPTVSLLSPGGTSSKAEISFASTPGKSPSTSNITPQKGSSSKIPRWNSSLNHDGSMSDSTTSPDTVRRNPKNEIPQLHKNSSSESHAHPRQGSQDSQGTASRQKSPELDRDSGFMGSESSRQSQLTNHSGPGKASSGVYPVDAEKVHPTRTRRLSFQRQPSYDSYDGPVTLQLESDQEDRSITQSEQTTVRYQPPDRAHKSTTFTNGHSSAIPRKSERRQPEKQMQPPAKIYKDYITPQPSDCLPRKETPYAAKNRSKTVPDSRQSEIQNTKFHRNVNPQYERSHNVNPQYERSHNVNPQSERLHNVNPQYERSHNVNPQSERLHNVNPQYERSHNSGRHKDSMYPGRLFKSDEESLHHDDSVSNVTRSSIKSAALKSLKNEIELLKDRLSETENAKCHERESTPHRKEFSRRKKFQSGSVSDTSSVRSEVLHSLQDEVRKLKGKLAVRDSAPQDSNHISNRSDLRQTLREKYIPRLSSGEDNIARLPDPSYKRSFRPTSSNADDNFVGSGKRSSLGTSKGRLRLENTQTSICRHCKGSGVCSHDDQISQNEQMTAANSTPHTVHFESPLQSGYIPQFSAPQFASTPVNHAPQIIAPPVHHYISPPHAHNTSQYNGSSIPQNTPQHIHTPVGQQFISPPLQHTPQYISSPVQPTYAPHPQTTSTPQQPMTVREYIPTPVHSLPLKTDARFYVRNQEKRRRSQTSSEEEEFYYRRSPHSKSKTPTRHYIQRESSKKKYVSKSDVGLQAAVRVARHLKSTSKHMLNCVQQDLNNSISICDILA